MIEPGELFKVVTPFRRGDKDALVAAWRSIPGRRYRSGTNLNRVDQNRALWEPL